MTSVFNPKGKMHPIIRILCLAGLLALPRGLSAQMYGEWDRPCDGGYGPRFAAPFVHGVMFGGREFLTQWRSETLSKPLPSLNWYVATPDPDPVSTDNAKVWNNAGVQVHCWVQRTPYWISMMADPVAYRGNLSDNCNRGAGGAWLLQPAPDGSSGPYDPYSSGGDEECDGTSEESPAGDGSSGSGTQYQPGDNTGGETVGWGDGIGDGGTSVCGADAVVEYVCIDVWDDRSASWTEWDCGYVTTC